MERALSFVFFTMLLFLSAVAASTSTYQLYKFWNMSANFIIVSTYAVCEKPLNNRCVTHYLTRNANGTSGDLAPFGYEFEPEALETGSRIVKRGNSFSNEINGKQALWPYFWQHVVVSLLGAVGLLLWYLSGGLKVLFWWLHGLLRTQRA